MSREELFSQYDRFLQQARAEIHEVYWMFNFFFVASAGLLGAYLLKDFEKYSELVVFLGLLLTLFWIYALVKQLRWRDWWIEEKIVPVQKELNLPDNLEMWKGSRKRFYSNLLQLINPFDKSALWDVLTFIPLVFSVIWIYLLYSL